MWTRPHPIDVTATREVPTPEPWKRALPDQPTVDVLELGSVDGVFRGWCTAGAEMRGPEVEVVCGGVNTKQPSHVGIWRQGHLLHFGFEPSPSQLNATGRKLLLNGIDYIARFVTDRPIVRVRSFVHPSGPGPSLARLEHLLAADDGSAAALAAMFAEPWRSRVAALDDAAARAFVRDRRPALRVAGNEFGFSELALALGIDLRSAKALGALANKLETGQREAATALLLELLPEGPDAGTTANNWRSWLRARQRYLAHDPFAMVFRIDPVAQWRRVASEGLRGPDRADGEAEPDPAAVALAAKVVAFHGGRRAFDDLEVFSCRYNDVHYLWDRRRGICRIENHGELPARSRATPWRVVVFDTLAEADLVTGGGPPPRPRISGRGMYRTLVERIFLPLLLLEPGTSLELLGESYSGHERLAVRIVGRGLDPSKTHVLHVEPSGEVVGYDLGPTAGSRVNLMRIANTAEVGPLTLPAKLTRDGPRIREIAYADLSWNPAVPAGISESRDFVLGGR